MNRQLICVLLSLLFFGVLSGEEKSEYKYQLSICAVFRDQAPYLKEWIEFHRLLGVEHFYLTNHRSQDDYEAVLAPYIAAGIVELKHCHASIARRNWNRLQHKIYYNTIRRASHETYWLAIIDTDEFLFPVEGDNLVDFLQDYEGYGGLCVNWQLYGTSSVERVSEDELMIEKLIKRAETNYREPRGIKRVDNYFVKSIVKPHLVNTKARQRSAHYFHYIKGYCGVNEKKQKVKFRRSSNVSVEKIRINHYWTRDLHYFKHNKVTCRKRRHGKSEIDNAWRRLSFLSVVEDPILLRFVPELKRRVFSEGLTLSQ